MRGKDLILSVKLSFKVQVACMRWKIDNTFNTFISVDTLIIINHNRSREFLVVLIAFFYVIVLGFCCILF